MFKRVLYVLFIILVLLNIIIYLKNKDKEAFKNQYPYDVTYIINLLETQEGRRRWDVIKNMDEFHNKNRFPAIYGKQYNYLPEVNNNIITTEWDFGKWKYNESEIIPLDQGEIGVSLSHYYVWKKIVDENINSALVLEDDAINVHPNFSEYVNEIMKDVPSDWDMILLGFWLHKGDNGSEIIKNRIYKVKDFVLLHSYIINKKGALKFLNLTPIDMPIDSWISKYSDRVNIYRHHIVKESKNDKYSSKLIIQKRNEKQIKNTNNW
jgi:GR25 family glycosyltransferase involved in LPS biosynthesis